MLAPVPHLGRADVDWETIAEDYADKIIKALEVELPDLSKHIVTRRHFTPKMFESGTGCLQRFSVFSSPKTNSECVF